MQSVIESSRDKSGVAVFLFLTVVLAAAFFMIGHKINYSTTTGVDFTLSGEDSAAAVKDGNTIRKVVYLGVGVVGLFFLLRSMGRPFTFSDPLAVLLLAYWGYCVASTLWSADPSLTLRRSVVLSCCVVAMFGFTRQLKPDHILWIAFLCSASFVLTGFAAEIVLGAFKPWSGQYRFAGTVHPNGQGQLCGLMCISAFALQAKMLRARPIMVAAFIVGVVLLILTKSRTAGLAMILGVSVIWLPKAKGNSVAMACVGVPFALAILAILASLMGADVSANASNAATLGRNSGLGSFNGRVPLWSELIPLITERPILGSGYLSFWTPWRIESISEQLQWTIPDAHNEYIDTVLNLGLFGAMLLACITLVGLARSFAAYLQSRDEAYGFFAALIATSLFAGFFESGFAQPLGLVPFITASGIAFVACRMPAEARRRASVRRLRPIPVRGLGAAECN